MPKLEKYNFKDKLDMDRIIKENKDEKAFIIIGKYNAIVGIKYKYIKVEEKEKVYLELEELHKGEFCIVGMDKRKCPFYISLIPKELIQDRIIKIKEAITNPIPKRYKKEVLIF